MIYHIFKRITYQAHDIILIIFSLLFLKTYISRLLLNNRLGKYVDCALVLFLLRGQLYNIHLYLYHFILLYFGVFFFFLRNKRKEENNDEFCDLEIEMAINLYM